MSTNIFIHPLVVMNIADHQAREVAEAEKFDAKNPPKVLGAVFGTQSGGTIEILSSINLPYRIDEEKQMRIDEDAFTEDTDLYKQIFPEHECLGWYKTSPDVDAADLPFHKRFTEYNESPLFIRMNPLPKRTDKALPVKVFRMELRTVDDKPVQQFVEVAFKVVSDPSERLATDHVLREEEITTKGSVIVPELREIRRALLALHSRVKLCHDYLSAVEAKKVEPNEEILQKISALLSRLPTMTSDRFDDDFFTEMSDGMAMTLLASIAKCTAKVGDSMSLAEFTGEGGGLRGARGLRGAMRRFA